MTEIEFKTILLELTALRPSKKPSHVFSIEFYDLVSNEQIEEFITELNDFLESINFGVCDIWGVNEDLTGGIFHLNLNEKTNNSVVIDKLKDLAPSYPFLEKISIILKTKEGNEFVTKTIRWGQEEFEDSEYYPNLPIPEGVNYSNKLNTGGCMVTLGLLISICLFFITLC